MDLGFANTLDDDDVDALEPVAPPRLVVLDFTYDDPVLKVLGNVASSEWEDNLKEVLKDGRLRNDLWALGLPEPTIVMSVSIVHEDCLRVRASMLCDESMNLTSVLDPHNKNIKQLKIKSIDLITEETSLPSGDMEPQHGDRSKMNTDGPNPTRTPPPITTIIDYHRWVHQPVAPSLPSLLLSSETPFRTPRRSPTDTVHNTPATSRTIASWVATSPASPSPVVRLQLPTNPSLVHSPSAFETDLDEDSSILRDSVDWVEDTTTMDLKCGLREEFEILLKQRMAELQATFNYEKRQLETQIDNLRLEFETLLVQRMAEVQDDFDEKEGGLRARIVLAEDHAERERLLRVRLEERRSNTLVSEDTVDRPTSPSNSRYPLQPDALSMRKVLEQKTFAADLEEKLQDRRLDDDRRQLRKTEEKLKNTEARLKYHELALAYTKQSLAKAAACNHAHDQAGSRPCEACEVKNRSARLSELHLRAMELRVAMFERRVIETESNSVWLVRGLQAERRRRLQAEEALKVERQKRYGAEAAAETIAREAEWPFMAPALLDLFLKLEGMTDEVILGV